MIASLLLLVLLTDGPSSRKDGPMETEPVYSPIPALCTPSPDHRRLAMATWNGGVRVVDLETGAIVARADLQDHGKLVDLAWSGDGSRIGCAASSGMITVIDSTSGGRQGQIETGLALEPLTQDHDVHFLDGGAVLVAGQGNSQAEVWRYATGSRVGVLSFSSDEHVTAVATSRDRSAIAVGGSRGTIRVWDAMTLKVRESVTLPPTATNGQYGLSGVTSLDFAPSGTSLAVAGCSSAVRLWTLGEPGFAREYSHEDENLGGLLCIGLVRFSADGKRLLSTSLHFWEARVWDTGSGKGLLRVSNQQGRPVPMPAWLSSDGLWLTTPINPIGARIDDPTTVHAVELSDKNATPWMSDGDLSWAEVAGVLLVRRAMEEKIILRIPIRPK